jgi:hypothetical protein
MRRWRARARFDIGWTQLGSKAVATLLNRSFWEGRKSLILFELEGWPSGLRHRS